MVAPIGLYTQLAHDRDADYKMMVDGKVRAVVLLQPDANMVCKVWDRIKNRPGARIILRVWDWDDGRMYVGDPGVYQLLQDHPALIGKQIVHKFSILIKEMRAWANKEGKSFPRNDQLICHLINEPDTNIYERNICVFTDAAVLEAETLDEKIYLLCLNFGTGHPARQVGGAGTDPDWRPYQATINLINRYGHYIGLHEYYNNTGITNPDMNPWHVLRHTMKTAQKALKDSRVIIAEYGLEMLVNHAMDDHHGWWGVISAEQFGKHDMSYYALKVAPFVEDIIIFANDLPDRTWNSFDAVPAQQFIVPLMQDIWKSIEAGGGTVDPVPPVPPEKTVYVLLWPAKGIVTQRFGENYESYMKAFGSMGHNGLDVANTSGTPIVAVADGIVKWSGVDKDYGNYVRVWHPSLGLHSFYAHLSEPRVQSGQTVSMGQVIGLMGSTGNSTGPHLHFEIRFGTENWYAQAAYGHTRGRVDPETAFYLLGGKDSA